MTDAYERGMIHMLFEAGERRHYTETSGRGRTCRTIRERKSLVDSRMINTSVFHLMKRKLPNGDSPARADGQSTAGNVLESSMNNKFSL